MADLPPLNTPLVPVHILANIINHSGGSNNNIPVPELDKGRCRCWVDPFQSSVADVGKVPRR